MKKIILSLLLIFLFGCVSNIHIQSNLDNTKVIIDDELAWNICHKQEGCVLKLNIDGIDYFFIYSSDNNCVIGHEINHILKYKQTGIWNEENE